MYAWLFNKIPGPLWARALTFAVLAGALVCWLFASGFALVEPLLPFGQSGLDSEPN